MSQLDLQKIIETHYPKFNEKNKLQKKILYSVYRKIIRLREINNFMQHNKDTKGIELIESLFEYLNFSFNISHKDIKRIPAEGKLVCVSNHPIGSLDGLALLKMISEIREDVKVIANDILFEIEELSSYFLPFNLETTIIQRQNIKRIDEALRKEEAIIIFPAGEVSRLKFFRIIDSKWHKGAVYFSKKNNAPILPIYIKAKNSALFYAASSIHKYFSRFLLVHELFNKKDKVINIKIGDPIPASTISANIFDDKVQIKLLKKHVLRIGKGKKGIFKTEKNIIHPIHRKFIKRELMNSEIIGETSDGKKIFLCEFHKCKNVMQEIARLRELTFRKVGEGTGKKLDLDRFDKLYNHIVVWDENDLEIVGSYRLGLGKEIMKEVGVNGFYTSTLFKFSEDYSNKNFGSSLELGRSFIQKKYWKTNALHYLWQGIGAFLYRHPEITHLFGGVSISRYYTQTAIELIVFYYSKWYGNFSEKVVANKKLKLSEKSIKSIENEFIGRTAKEDYIILKELLKPLGFTVPTLYKQYTELCDQGGVEFLGFGIDESFEMCIDGFIQIEVDKIRADKRARYIDIHNGQNAVA